MVNDCNDLSNFGKLKNQPLGNEESVGKAIRDSGVPRNEIFVTTKLM